MDLETRLAELAKTVREHREVLLTEEAARYLGTFSEKNETRHAVEGPVDLYRFETELLARVAELDGP